MYIRLRIVVERYSQVKVATFMKKNRGYQLRIILLLNYYTKNLDLIDYKWLVICINKKKSVTHLVAHMLKIRSHSNLFKN